VYDKKKEPIFLHDTEEPMNMKTKKKHCRRRENENKTNFMMRKANDGK